MTDTLAMKKIMTDFFEDTDFPKNGRNYLLGTLCKIEKNDAFVNAYNTYLQGKMNKDLLLDICKKISEETDLNEYTVSLLLVISFTGHLKQIYKEKNYPMDIYINSVTDLKYKAEECFDTKKVYGTFVADWLYKWFVPERFGIGRLQFEIVLSGYDYKTLTKDTPCLKIHIPRSGKPLTPESIDDALSRAKEFFKDDFEGPIPIVCKSWLLYEKFEGLFKQGSNTDLFRKRFEIIDNISDPKGCYPDMWRLFDMDFTGNIDDYPENTSLRKSFKEYLKNGGETGTAHGVFFI